MLLSLATITPQQNKQEVLPGVWRFQIGSQDKPTLTDAAGAVPKADRIASLPKADLPFDLSSVQEERTRDASVVRIPLKPGERIFGLGLQMNGSDRRGGVYHLRVDHYASGHDRLHVPTPLYVSSLGYAVFFNTSRPIDIYVGVGNRLDDPNIPQFRDRNTDPKWDAQPDSGWVEASVEGAGLETYVFSGPTSMDALRRYVLFCGGGAMPPIWALGFWHRTRSVADASEVIAEADEFKKRGFPLDVIGLEPGWESRSYPGTMEWDSGRFPDPAGFLGEMSKRSIHVNLWENPYVAPGSDLYKRLDPHFGSHTVWLGAVPDIYSPQAAKIERDFHREKHLGIGVSGYKIDEVDGFDQWLWPDHATFPSGPGGLQMRQIYGVLWQKVIDDMFRETGKRTFGLVRGSNGAATRFPFAIYSDTYDHRQYVTALTNSALAGAIWCAEIRDADSGEEWVRRMQSTCLSPIAQLNAWSSGKKPWSFPEVEGEIRDAMLLRESLLPYLYTAFSEYAKDGIPVVRPMSLIDGGLETDQYMLGDSLLVAPMFTGEHSRKVRLPAGKWFEYKSGNYAGSDAVITVSPGLSDMPIFVRGGSALPTSGPGPISTSSPCVLRCYGEGPWSCLMYQDDGVSFGFEHDDFGLFRVDVNEGKVSAKHLAGARMDVGRELSVAKL